MPHFENEPQGQSRLGQSSAAPSIAEESPAVSKLAAKVAHELNNPLDAVLRFVSLAQRNAKVGDYSNLDRYLADAQFGLQRMAEILRDLMNIGQQTHEVLTRSQPMPLAELIDHAARTCAAQAEQKQVRIVQQNLLPATLSPRYDVRLSQVVANLIKNAVEATPELAAVEVSLRLSPENRIQITVQDSGPGISRELVPQLFTPFVTTKPRGAGYGLGLAISRELVVSLGGTLTIENRPLPACGCTATIILPNK